MRTPLAALIALALLGGGAPVEATPGPDIYLIMLDDHAYMPNDPVLRRLPYIERVFLKRGRQLSRIYNEAPLCCPARASVLSGQHTLRNGVIENDGNPLDMRRTLAVALDRAGYHTILVGKLLNKWAGDKRPPGWDRISWMRGNSSIYWRQGVKADYRPLFPDEANRQQLVEWVRAAPTDRPLFAWASVRAPHVYQRDWSYLPPVMKRDRGAPACRGLKPFRPPTYSLEKQRGTSQPMPDWPKGWRLRETCESLLVVDRMVGQLRRIARERGRPAVWILMSDNGMAWGQKGEPFKRTPQSSRLPFYVTGPGIEPGRETALLSIIDLPVTIADLAGADMPWADGVSFLPLLRGEATSVRDDMLQVMPDASGAVHLPWSGILTRDWHYLRWQDGHRQLYRYRTDTWEQYDLAATHPDVTDQLDARLDQLIEESRP
jgi:N-acetylglucosamine-6-sulfatase